MIRRAILGKATIAAWFVFAAYVVITIYFVNNFSPKILAEPGTATPPSWALSVYDFMRPFWARNQLIVPGLLAISVSITLLWYKKAKQSTTLKAVGSP
jgi:hypothetical protein